MRKLVLLSALMLTGCDDWCSGDYVVQYDAARHSYYIYSCSYYFPLLEIGYGSFSSYQDAAAVVKNIRVEGVDPNKRTHFIEVPK